MTERRKARSADPVLRKWQPRTGIEGLLRQDGLRAIAGLTRYARRNCVITCAGTDGHIGASIALRGPYFGIEGIDPYRKQSVREKRVGDALLFRQSGRRHHANPVRTMAVRFFHRGGVGAPETG